MRPVQTPRSARGFTAVELMIVVVIVAILTAMAAPWMGQMVRTQRLRTSSFDVLASLQLARSEAIKRNVAVTMAANSGSDWSTGWTVTDANGNVLKRQGVTDTTTMTGPTTIVFNGTGRLNGAVPAFDLHSQVDDHTTLFRCITVDLSGRAVSKEAACGP